MNQALPGDEPSPLAENRAHMEEDRARPREKPAASEEAPAAPGDDRVSVKQLVSPA
jgi:hypothetical protein